MAANPILARNPAQPRLAPAQARLEAVARGNAHLAEIGRNDIHWYIHQDKVCLGWLGSPRA